MDLLALQHLPSINEILEDFVQRVPDMQIAIGVGGSIVEYESGGVVGGGGGAQFVVEVGIGPELLEFGFAD
eukprot:CAMPEP_0194428888 /NCGR_PEP_ID=MMETSP0176-20130528/43558_1 /TAXON_ID=216777 /ORGANISM="Proboscia alata, Strain PI-D3" /LENGTH=70 /DNA_ID=CAMNT_0039241557 /DNA_START=81 /DNA_END=290 /DNA_ORIENTATION=-